MYRGVAVPPARMPSKHEARWEHRKMLPAGCLRAQSLVQGAAIARVLDGEIGTVEGGSLLFHELMEEGIEISPELTPMNLSGQIRYCKRPKKCGVCILVLLMNLLT